MQRLADIAATFGVSRNALNVRSTSRDLFAGSSITFYFRDGSPPMKGADKRASPQSLVKRPLTSNVAASELQLMPDMTLVKRIEVGKDENGEIGDQVVLCEGEVR
jgi:hypothetical protein